MESAIPDETLHCMTQQLHSIDKLAYISPFNAIPINFQNTFDHFDFTIQHQIQNGRNQLTYM